MKQFLEIRYPHSHVMSKVKILHVVEFDLQDELGGSKFVVLRNSFADFSDPSILVSTN